jgi:2-oxoisovalerate dehydrogenase E1 component alpha subunit
MPDDDGLRLHIPAPVRRPGDAPDFSGLDLPAPDQFPRPDVATPSRALIPLADGLVRVLDSDGKAIGSWNPGLDEALLLRALRSMMLTRAFDERMLRAQRQGKLSFYVPSTGEEGVAVAQTLALDPGDMLFPSYRQQGALITRGGSIVDMMCQLHSNAGDRLKGRQMPTFYSSRTHKFFSISGNLGTQFSQAVGWAMASALRRDTAVAATWIGEGATAEADFHYAMTFASVYGAPVILNVVNNQWAISSCQAFAGGAQATFAARAIGYGVPGIRVDGNDVLAVYSVTEWARRRAMANLGPTLIELFTYRAAAHSTSDDPGRYRSADEARNWPLGDPIERLKQHLVRRGAWSEERHTQLAAELMAEVRDAAKEAEAHGTLMAGTQLSASSMFEDVFKEMPWHLRRQRQELGV